MISKTEKQAYLEKRLDFIKGVQKEYVENSTLLPEYKAYAVSVLDELLSITENFFKAEYITDFVFTSLKDANVDPRIVAMFLRLEFLINNLKEAPPHRPV